jgi:bifunctional oligoribonuclease and PAP phosphatase NrnA
LTEKAIVEIKKILSTSKKVTILTHVNPDGDAIGASLAMFLYLKQKKHQVSVITPNDLPTFLKWMPESDNIIVNSNNTQAAFKLINEAELFICLDFNSLNRIEKLAEPFKNSNATKILIDHHIEPEDFANFILSYTNTSSTSEIVYDFIDAMGDVNLINKEIAACLYVGIATDTGSFSYACNYSHTYDIISKLMLTGIDAEHIHRLVYDTYSEDRMRLLGFCLSEKMKVISQYSTAFISLTKAELKRFNHQTGDTEGIVNFPLSIGNVKMAVLLIEKDDHVRLSFRSKGDFHVNSIAKKYFNGGGHKNAAGGNSPLSMEETINKFINLLPELNFN